MILNLLTFYFLAFPLKIGHDEPFHC